MSDLEELKRLQFLNGLVKMVFSTYGPEDRRRVVTTFISLGAYDQLGQAYEKSTFPEARCIRCQRKYEDYPVVNVTNKLLGSSGWVHKICVIQ